MTKISCHLRCKLKTIKFAPYKAGIYPRLGGIIICLIKQIIIVGIYAEFNTYNLFCDYFKKIKGKSFVWLLFQMHYVIITFGN